MQVKISVEWKNGKCKPKHNNKMIIWMIILLHLDYLNKVSFCYVRGGTNQFDLTKYLLRCIYDKNSTLRTAMYLYTLH